MKWSSEDFQAWRAGTVTRSEANYLIDQVERMQAEIERLQDLVTRIQTALNDE